MRTPEAAGFCDQSQRATRTCHCWRYRASDEIPAVGPHGVSSFEHCRQSWPCRWTQYSPAHASPTQTGCHDQRRNRRSNRRMHRGCVRMSGL